MGTWWPLFVQIVFVFHTVLLSSSTSGIPSMYMLVCINGGSWFSRLLWSSGDHRNRANYNTTKLNLLMKIPLLFLNKCYWKVASLLLISRFFKSWLWQYLPVFLLLLWWRELSEILILPSFLTYVKWSFLIIMFLLYLLGGNL